MVFDPLTSGEIAPGEPVKSTTTTKVKDNFDDHEERITDLEGGSAVDYPPLIMGVSGIYSDLATADRTAVLFTTCNFNMRFTGGRLIIQSAGASGTTEIDIKVSSDGVTWNSIFSTKPSVAFGAGDYAVSSNGVINNTYRDITAGYFIRLDITGVQSGGDSFITRLDYQRI